MKIVHLPVIDDFPLLADRYDNTFVLDAEWKSSNNDEIINSDTYLAEQIRQYSDFLSLQVIYIHKKTVKRDILFFEDNETMLFVDLLSQYMKIDKLTATQRVISVENGKEVRKRVDKDEKTAPKVCLITFFGGVDISVFTDYRKIVKNSNVIVQNKQAVVTTQPAYAQFYDKNKEKYHAKIEIRDIMKLAPGHSSLASVGNAINMPKIDTTVWDSEDNKPFNYYKSHMDKLLKHRKQDFINYAMNDVDITAKYADTILGVFDGVVGEKKKLPMTLGSLCASRVSSYRKNDPKFMKYASLAIGTLVNGSKEVIDMRLPDGFRSPIEWNKNGTMANTGVLRLSDVSPARYNEYIKYAIDAYFGGANIAFISGVMSEGRRKLDIDLVSAYNVAGHLIPKFYANKPHKVLHDVNADEFKREMDSVNGVYTVGTGIGSIKFHDNIVITPQRDSPKHSPKYLRNVSHQPLPLTDFYSAMLFGADVFLDTVDILDQEILDGTLKTINWAGQFQDYCAKKRAEYSKGTLENMLWKELGNSVYGKTGQGLHQKKSRDITDNQMYFEPLSSISNPYLAGQYTSITRFHAMILIKSIEKTSPYTLLSMTTDGILIALDGNLDENALNKVIREFSDNHCKLYTKVANAFFGGKYYEIKGNGTGEAFNLKTRFDGVCGTEISAMTGVKNTTNEQIIESLKNGINSIDNTQKRMSNAVEMVHENKIKSLLTTKSVEITSWLIYDFARRPIGFKTDGDLGYFVTVPFDTPAQAERYKVTATNLLKVKQHFVYDGISAKFFIETMDNVLNHGLELSTKYEIDYRANCFLKFCYINNFTFDRKMMYQNLVDLGYSRTYKTFINRIAEYKKQNLKREQVDVFTGYKLFRELKKLGKI